MHGWKGWKKNAFFPLCCNYANWLTGCFFACLIALCCNYVKSECKGKITCKLDRIKEKQFHQEHGKFSSIFFANIFMLKILWRVDIDCLLVLLGWLVGCFFACFFALCCNYVKRKCKDWQTNLCKITCNFDRFFHQEHGKFSSLFFANIFMLKILWRVDIGCLLALLGWLVGCFFACLFALCCVATMWKTNAKVSKQTCAR